MKKLIGLMVALILALSLCACGGQPVAEQKAENGDAVETETTEVTEAVTGEVTQADIEKNIVGDTLYTNGAKMDCFVVNHSERSIYRKSFNDSRFNIRFTRF